MLKSPCKLVSAEAGVTDDVLGHGPRRLTLVPGGTGCPVSDLVTRPRKSPPPSGRLRLTLLTVLGPVIWMGSDEEKSVARLFGLPLYHPNVWPVASAVTSHSPVCKPVRM